MIQKIPSARSAPLVALILTRAFALGLALGLGLSATSPARAAAWSQLPAIPDAEGFAGAFAGVSGGALVVAGGANIAGDKWREPLAKRWYDGAFVLDRPDGAWRGGFQLPRALGYGVSVSADDSVLCFGGSDADRHYADSFRLRWRGDKIETTPLPPLPRACANACGALVGRTVYLAGGLETPTATGALHTFWALDLDAAAPRWRELPPWPGPARMLAVAGAHDGAFYLFSGAALRAGPDGKPARTFLRDAYRFTPAQGWTRLADLPRAAAAAPSPAATVGGTLLVFTGDDGAHVAFQPVAEHPGFPRTTLAYEVKTDRWRETPGVPFSRATVPTVVWRDRLVVPNGEVRPRVRTNEIWSRPLAAP